MKTAPQLSSNVRQEFNARSRPLYYWNLDSGEKSGLVDTQQLGMELSQISDTVHANETLNNSVSAVVLVQFPKCTDDAALDLFEQLVSESWHCIWIALLPEQWQQQERLCGLITHAFFDYHQLPTEYDRLRIIVGHAFGMLALRHQVEAQACPEEEQDQLIGSSPPLQRLKRTIARVANSHSSVLLTGESGTGKELVARAIHRQSPLCSAPFDAINCAALPASLIQAELFGHEKGAYTGANQRMIGRFEACNGGTLFLDEIGDMPAEQQVNLLRVLEQGSLRRIGGSRDIPINVRVIAATHANLEQKIQQGVFREDLFYRLNVVNIEVPPLRERNGDIELLARYFFQRFHIHGQAGPGGFSREAIEAMRHHSWPGNVRELINRVQHAVIMAEGPLIQRQDLGIERRDRKRRRITLETARNEAEIRAINDALHRCHHNVSEAARELGISRVGLYRQMEKHDITPH
ncbi:MAG: sigma-54 dependent transcriptional regulator [Gammaproteobacteria bacterium]|nr:sigma-54 dependent transcriptional regulator [Gammaproteobacteria bacterium]